jgi:O-antigen ligase
MKERLEALPFAGLLFILPFPGTVALRLLCLAAALLVAMLAWRRWSTPSWPAKPAILIWVLVAAASVAYSFDPGYSLGEFKNEFVYTLMAYLAFFAFARGEQELGVLLAALGAGVVVVSLWGIAGTWQGGIWQEGGGHGGAGSVSAFFSAVAPLFAVAMFAPQARRTRYALVLALLLIVAAAVATRQRILWPLFLVEAALGAILLRVTGILRWSGRAGALAAAGGLVIAGIALAGLQQWRESTHSTRPLEVDARLTVWPQLTARILEQPLAGAGLGRQAMRKVYPDLVPREDSLLWHGHNVFLNAGISMGLPGVLALLFVFGSFLAAYASLLRTPNRTVQLVGIAGILLLTGVIGRNLTNDFFVRDGSLLFWAVNGALLGAGLRTRPAAPPVRASA